MIAVEYGDAHNVAEIMPVMQKAFDPAFGEAWTAAQTLAALSLPNSRLAIAKDNTVIGFAISRWVLEEEELLMIAVAPDQQRKGIASILLKQIIAEMVNNERKTLFLEVRDGNPAHIFYKNKGFNEIGRRRNYYTGANGMTFDAITMNLSIQ
ncbi:ribosomal protein S18-alanine N-acetyltransferase [Sphingorhabdus arenilitoris]|uniref:[Ribosomal protein bS18]-alanine N-acetyltransferase n=1 Tax=Sphingorhabdus arenilitoris TaxID=1490041 RepID=A0ABV8RI99_9SPHN